MAHQRILTNDSFHRWPLTSHSCTHPAQVAEMPIISNWSNWLFVRIPPRRDSSQNKATENQIELNEVWTDTKNKHKHTHFDCFSISCKNKATAAVEWERFVNINGNFAGWKCEWHSSPFDCPFKWFTFDVYCNILSYTVPQLSTHDDLCLTIRDLHIQTYEQYNKMKQLTTHHQHKINDWFNNKLCMLICGSRKQHGECHLKCHS